MILFVGDTVRHRGNSQRMEIASIYGEYATCKWDDAGMLRRRSFKLSELAPCVDTSSETSLPPVFLPLVPRGTFSDESEADQ